MTNITAVILTIKDGVDVSELGTIIKHEQEIVAKWKSEGLLHDMYLRQERNGAVLLFSELNQETVQEMIESLPLYPYFKSAEYLNLLK